MQRNPALVGGFYRVTERIETGGNQFADRSRRLKISGRIISITVGAHVKEQGVQFEFFHRIQNAVNRRFCLLGGGAAAKYGV